MFGLSIPAAMRPSLRVALVGGSLHIECRGDPGSSRWCVASQPARRPLAGPDERFGVRLLEMPGARVLAEVPLTPAPEEAPGQMAASSRAAGAAAVPAPGEQSAGRRVARFALPASDREWLGLRLLEYSRDSSVTPASDTALPYIIPLAQIAAGGLIDTHAHVGRLAPHDYSLELLTELMTEGHVRRALVSNLDGSACDQVATNRRMLELAARDRRIAPVFWGNPVEGLGREARALLESGGFAGLKLHPLINGYRADDDRLADYFDLARDLGLFVLVHTDMQDPARPARLERWLSSYPQVAIVLGHTGLWGAWQEAIDVIARHPSARGDLAWFGRFDLLARAIERGHLSRFVFGSDAPVDGEDAYQQYMAGLMSLGLERPQLAALLADNAAALAPTHRPVGGTGA